MERTFLWFLVQQMYQTEYSELCTGKFLSLLLVTSVVSVWYRNSEDHRSPDFPALAKTVLENLKMVTED